MLVYDVEILSIYNSTVIFQLVQARFSVNLRDLSLEFQILIKYLNIISINITTTMNLDQVCN